MSYPFPTFQRPSSQAPQCILPHHVDNIQTYQQCKLAVKGCEEQSKRKAYETNNPKYNQFAQGFFRFANQDAIRTVHVESSGETNNRVLSSFEYSGGCNLLKNRTTSQNFWPHAKELLKQELNRYHTNESSSIRPQTALLTCKVNNGVVTCNENENKKMQTESYFKAFL